MSLNKKKATAEIGPGQYIPLTLYKFEKPNIVPFNASSKIISVKSSIINMYFP